MKKFLSPILKKNWAELPLHEAIFSFFPAIPLPLGHIGSATSNTHSTCIIVPLDPAIPLPRIPGIPKFSLTWLYFVLPYLFYAQTYFRESIVLYDISCLHSLLSCAGPLMTQCMNCLLSVKRPKILISEAI